MKRMNVAAALLLAGAMAVSPTFSAAQSATEQEREKLTPVEEETAGGISYLSGGVGIEERENLRALAEKYNAQLVFALQEGNYLADVDVLIADAGGNRVLQTTTQGPWLYATLPPGAYQVEATINGEKLSKRIEVQEGERTQTFFLW